MLLCSQTHFVFHTLSFTLPWVISHMHAHTHTRAHTQTRRRKTFLSICHLRGGFFGGDFLADSVLFSCAAVNYVPLFPQFDAFDIESVLVLKVYVDGSV